MERGSRTNIRVLWKLLNIRSHGTMKSHINNQKVGNQKVTTIGG